jgi:hypothetical protein
MLFESKDLTFPTVDQAWLERSWSSFNKNFLKTARNVGRLGTIDTFKFTFQKRNILNLLKLSYLSGQGFSYVLRPLKKLKFNSFFFQNFIYVII